MFRTFLLFCGKLSSCCQLDGLKATAGHLSTLTHELASVTEVDESMGDVDSHEVQDENPWTASAFIGKASC